VHDEESHYNNLNQPDPINCYICHNEVADEKRLRTIFEDNHLTVIEEATAAFKAGTLTTDEYVTIVAEAVNDWNF
jgi:hypothetical protein